MIPITRTPEPTSLATNKTDWLDALAIAIYAYNTATTDPDIKAARKVLTKAESAYRNKQVKDALKVMQGGKCAYCESNITAITYGCIEHFRPKSKYPTLCFEWGNLFLACDQCNISPHKSDKFPIATQGGPYIDPATEDPSLFFKFVYDPSTEVAVVVAKNNNVRAKTMIDDLGLNRRRLARSKKRYRRQTGIYCYKG